MIKYKCADLNSPPHSTVLASQLLEWNHTVVLGLTGIPHKVQGRSEVLLRVGADLGQRPCGDALRYLLPFAAVHLEPLEELLVLFPRPSAR